jgi:organic hydroperoxide reductase OsmC/OhrA
MSEHKVKISWSRGDKDFTYKTYSRDHLWTFDNKVQVSASAAPAYLGNPDYVDPEGAFVAALSSCHMLSFLAICARKNIAVDSYQDDAVGFLEKNASGKLAITRVELRPHVEFTAKDTLDATALAGLHDQAHHGCFIASSVLTQVSVLPR